MGLVSSGPPWARVSTERSLELRTLEPAFLVSPPTFTYSLCLGPTVSGDSHWNCGMLRDSPQSMDSGEARTEMPKVRLARGRCSSVIPRKGGSLGQSSVTAAPNHKLCKL